MFETWLIGPWEVNLGHVQKRTEPELIQGALAGDLDSFGELAGLYYTSMVSVAYAVLGDHQLAEDAAQEAYAKALVCLARLRNPARFGPWMAAICRNVAHDMAKARHRQRNSTLPVPASQARDCDDTVLLVRRVIAQLPARTRELIILRYYQRLSYEQICAVLGVSKATVNGRLTRAKRKLAGLLERNGFSENRS